MTLGRLQIAQFRNISQASVDFSPGINLIHGPNGSGKTSLLEAVHFLSTGRSFRGVSLDPVIRRGEEACTLSAAGTYGHRAFQLGMERNRDGSRRIRLNGANVHRASDLARVLPVLMMGPESVALLQGPPDIRRRFLNWGVFHVEQSFTSEWEEANRSLRQRNQLLRQGSWRQGEIESWTEQLIFLAEQLDLQRQQWIEHFRAAFQFVAAEVMQLEDLDIQYYRGWPKDKTLAEIYAEDLEKDKKKGFTQRGFQRADVRIVVGGQPATKVCSRGELKIITWSMLMAQGRLLDQSDLLYLVDDLASEFDSTHRRRVTKYLTVSGHQVLMTGVDQAVLVAACEQGFDRMFHVEHGIFQEQ